MERNPSMLKTKEGFIMRKLGNEYMVVAVGEAKMQERFDDLDRATAEKDLEDFIGSIRFALV